MRSLLRFLRRLAPPAISCALLNGVAFVLSIQYVALAPLREPLDILFPGLAGVWVTRGRQLRPWPAELLAGAAAGLVVGAVRVLLGHYVAGLPASPEFLLLGRALLAGAIGAMVSRLLHQRVVL